LKGVDWEQLHIEEGLNVNVKIAPGQKVYEALLAGDSDFIAVSYGSMMKINQQGKKIVSVCSITRNCLFHLVAQPGIQSIDDLKGKRIGVPKVGEEVTAVIRAALKRKGIDPDKEVKWVSVGIQATMIAAMKRGEIDAVGAVGEWRDHLLRAVPGTHVLIDYSETADLKAYLGATTYPLAHVQVTAEFAEKYPETTQRVVHAIIKSLHFIHTHSPEACIDVVKDKYWAEADREVLVKYMTEIKDAFSSNGITEKSGYDVVARVNSEAGLLKTPAPDFAAITDLHFVERADRRLGFK
jgi:NitT/TauT family transport system substrate-binding protein